MDQRKTRSPLKKALTAAIMLMTAGLALSQLSALPASAGGASYDLWIDNTQVTDGNAGDILRNGAFSYDASLNTLYINGSYTFADPHSAVGYISTEDGETIEYTYADGYGILNRQPGLKIITENDAELVSNGNLIFTDSDLTFRGAGRLTLTSDCVLSNGIHISGKEHAPEVTFDHADVKIEAYTCLFANNWYDALSNVRFIGSSVEMSGNNIGSWGDVQADFSSGSYVADPPVWKNDHGIALTSGSGSISHVDIRCDGKAYPLKICGVPVSEYNKDDILDYGKFTYLPQSRLLIVYGSAEYDGTVIDCDIPITIDVQGGGTLKSNHADAIRGGNGELYITGAGNLSLEAPEGCGIFMDNDTYLRICELNRLEISSAKYGIRGPVYDPPYGDTNLSIEHTDVSIYVSDAAIERIGGLFNLSACEVYSPKIEYGLDTNGIYLIDADTNETAYYVSIRKTSVEYTSYWLDIGGIPVSNFNKDDILSNGVFKYDPDENVLEINGDYKYNVSTRAIIYNNIENLTIRTVKDSVLTAESGWGLSTGANMTLTGSGRLTMTADDYSIYVYPDCKLTIRNADLELKGDEGAIYAFGENPTLDIQKSHIHAVGTIGWFSPITLTDCEIVEPDGGGLRDDGYAVVDSNNRLAEEVTIDPSIPKITAHPQDTEAAVGTTAKFSVSAQGSNLRYQWQFDNGNGWTDSSAASAATDTLKVSVTAAKNGFRYRCIVSDADGNTRATKTATLHVGIKITAQPQAASVYAGNTATFTVGATGVELRYRWEFNNGNGWTYSTATSASTDTLKVSVTAAKNGFQYRCIIYDANGKTKTSSAATLNVLTKITAQPKSASAYVGDTAAFTVTATGAGLKYQWQYDSGKGWTNSTASTAKKATLSVPVTAAKNGFKYQCIITDANGNTKTTSAVTLTVLTKITAQPKAASGYVGDTVKFTVTATGAGLTYQWMFNNGKGWANSTASTAKNAELSVPVTAAKNGFKYQCVITDANGKTKTSSAVGLTVLTKITAQPTAASNYVGETAKFTVTATGAGLKYQWQFNSGNGWTNSTATSATTDTLKASVTGAKNGFQYRCIITDANGKTKTTSAVKLTVMTKITKQPVSTSGSVGSTVKFSVTATGAGLTYQWQYDSGKGWTNSTASTAKAAALSVPVTAAKNGFKYRCIITDANGKTKTSSSATLTVK